MCIPLLYEFGIPHDVKMHVIDWHANFDALLGSSDLRRLNAKIDYSTNTLELGEFRIPFLYQFTSLKVQPLKQISANYLRIPVTIADGEVIFPETALTETVTLPECIVTAKNGYCILPLHTPLTTEINFHERLPVTPLFETELESPPKTQGNADVLTQIRISHLNDEEKRKVVELCKKFKNIFYAEDSDLSFCNAVKHQIRTTDDDAVYVKSFRHPHAMQEEIQNQIQKLLDGKIIQPSISPYSAPVWVVPKKMDASGKKKYRMVIDFRKLNEKTKDERWPIPHVDEILGNLGKCSYFTTLDLAQGFHQIEMHPDSIQKTAFSVNNGHYEYLRMPFGLKNAPCTFQRVMDNVLREYLHKFCFVYMDDIVVFSKSLHEHMLHLRLIFEKLQAFNLKVQLDKTEFLRKEVAFLGHVVTPDGVKPNPSKLEAVENYPLPKNQKEIKSFLGLVGYYRKFIPKFAKLVSPLTRCLKKGATIKPSDPDYVAAFHQCKELLTNAPILAYPDFEKQFTLTTDASNVAVGGVLSQNKRPIAYYSRTLNSAERNYSTIERELLAILDCTKHFRPYLFGQHFKIETDHAPLVWLSKIKEPNSRLIRWKLKLDEFDFSISHVTGRTNCVADALSRVEINVNETDDLDSMIPNVNELPALSDEDLESIIASQNPDVGLMDLSDPHVLDNEPDTAESNDDGDLDTVHSTQEDNGKGIPITDKPVNTFQNRIVIRLGEKYKRRIDRPFNRNHHNITVTKESLISNLTDMIRDTFQPGQTICIYFVNQEIREPFLDLVKAIFNYSAKIYISNTFCKDVTDPDSQKEVVTDYHESSHNGINETLNQLKTKFYWPNMKNTITRVINTCELCLQAKYERHPYNPKFSGPLLAKRPFDIIHIDTFSFQGTKFLTIIDLFSRYAQAYYLKDGTSFSVLNKLRHFFAHHNVPQKIVADEGREFKNNAVEEFCKLNKVELHYTTVNNPNSNSPVERLHSTLVEKLRILNIKNPKDLPSNLMITATLIYNQSIHSSTGFSPFHLLYGPYERLIEFDIEMPVFERYNEKRKQEILPFYDQVYRKNKEKADKILEKRNRERDDPPDLTDQDIFIERNRPRKTDPPFERIKVIDQQQGQITGLTQKNNLTTVHVRKVKPLRKIIAPVQDDSDDCFDPDNPQPGPSGLQNKK